MVGVGLWQGTRNYNEGRGITTRGGDYDEDGK